jgi:hypothetical protein
MLNHITYFRVHPIQDVKRKKINVRKSLFLISLVILLILIFTPILSIFMSIIFVLIHVDLSDRLFRVIHDAALQRAALHEDALYCYRFNYIR